MIAPPTTNQTAEVMISSNSSPMEALQQILPRLTKKARKSPRYFGFDSNDSSAESTKSCPLKPTQPRRKRRAGDNESWQPSVVQNSQYNNSSRTFQ